MSTLNSTPSLNVFKFPTSNSFESFEADERRNRGSSCSIEHCSGTEFREMEIWKRAAEKERTRTEREVTDRDPAKCYVSQRLMCKRGGETHFLS